MNIFLIRISVLFFCLIPQLALTQGPPILTEKPIMLGQGRGTARVAYIHRTAAKFDAQYLYVGSDYNLSPNIAVDAGFTFFKYEGSGIKKPFLGEIMATLKYQYFTFNFEQKSIRLAVKLGHSKNIASSHLQLKPFLNSPWGTSSGIVASFESLDIGIASETLLNLLPETNDKYFQQKIEIGVPILPHKFPIRQMNLFLSSEWLNKIKGTSSGLFVSAGFQYIFETFLFEMCYQRGFMLKGDITFLTKTTFGSGIRFIY